MLNPLDAVKEVSEKLQEAGKSCGLDKVDGFIKAVEDIKTAAQKGPGDLMDKVVSAIEAFKHSVESALSNPAALANQGGPIAACGSWYAAEVVRKLKELMKDVEDIVSFVKKHAEELAKPLKSVAAVLEDALKALEGSAKAAASLPATVQHLAETVKSPADLGKVDMAPLKHAIDTSGLQAPLDKIIALKSELSGAVSSVGGLVSKMMEFLISAAEKVKDAFSVPQPLCFLTPMVLSQAPPLMQELIGKLDSAKGLDLKPFVDGLTKMAHTIEGVDVSAVKTPLEKFSKEAAGSIDKLDKAVSAAKASSGGWHIPGLG